MGKFAAGRTYLNNYIEKSGGNDQAHFRAAHYLHFVGEQSYLNSETDAATNKDFVLSHLRAAVDLNSENADAIWVLGWMTRVENPAGAEAALKRGKL